MKKLFCLLSCLFVMACGSGGQDSKTEATADDTHAQAAVQDMAVELATRNVSCGCVLEEIGHCGNYIEIESRYVAIANGEQLGLGGMEWCGKQGVQAESAGEIKNGKFVAATLVTK
jgi:hypothetical protein